MQIIKCDNCKREIPNEDIVRLNIRVIENDITHIMFDPYAPKCGNEFCCLKCSYDYLIKRYKEFFSL